MKHLKLFEAFGIDLGIEQQVDSYFDEIQNEPEKSKFNFLFRNDQVNCYFDLTIVPNLNSEGKLVEQGGKFDIYIKNRNDIATLLHEVKHLDYRIKNKKLYQTVYYKAKEIISNYQDTPKIMFEIFYLYDENEFEAKYHGYYKEFKEFCKDRLDENSNIQKVRYLWFKYLLACDDKSWTYYLVDKEFKFSNFISDRKLDECLYQMIQGGITKKEDLFKWSKNWILNNLKFLWIRFRQKMGIYNKQERTEIDKLKRYFEYTLKQRHERMRRKFTRMILPVANHYKIKY